MIARPSILAAALALLALAGCMSSQSAARPTVLSKVAVPAQQQAPAAVEWEVPVVAAPVTEPARRKPSWRAGSFVVVETAPRGLRNMANSTAAWGRYRAGRNCPQPGTSDSGHSTS